MRQQRRLFAFLGALVASFLVEPFITLGQQQGIATVLVPGGKINVADVKAQQQWYVDQGQVQQAIDVDKTVDAHFAQNALKVLGPYTP